MICKVLDGLFDKLYLHQLEYNILQIPVTSNNTANRNTYPYGKEGTHRLFGKTLFGRKDINRITFLDDKCEEFFDIFNMLENELKQKFFLNSISLNIQHSGCDGTTHIDSTYDDDLTILMMTNAEWDSKDGGKFQLTSVDGKEIIEEYEYIPGRIIIFPSIHPHRGLSPKNPYVYRTSIVWRVTEIQKYLSRFDCQKPTKLKYL